MSVKQNILKEVAEFMAKKGKNLSHGEYSICKDKPVHEVLIKRNFSSFSRVRKLVEANYPELFIEINLAGRTALEAEEIARLATEQQARNDARIAELVTVLASLTEQHESLSEEVDDLRLSNESLNEKIKAENEVKELALEELDELNEDKRANKLKEALDKAKEG